MADPIERTTAAYENVGFTRDELFGTAKAGELTPRQKFQRMLTDMALYRVLSPQDISVFMKRFDRYMELNKDKPDFTSASRELSDVVELLPIALSDDPDDRKLYIQQQKDAMFQEAQIAERLAEAEVSRKTLSFLSEQPGGARNILPPEMQQAMDAEEFSKETQKQRALGGLFVQEEPVTPVGIKPAQEVLDPFLATLSPNLKAFWERRQSQVLDPITQARQAWWQSLQEAQGAANVASQEAQSAAKARDVYYDRPFELEEELGALPAMQAQSLQTRAEEASTSSGQAQTSFERLQQQDPLKKYLGEFDWLKPYITTPQRQRGFYPGIKAPPAVWR